MAQKPIDNLHLLIIDCNKDKTKDGTKCLVYKDRKGEETITVTTFHLSCSSSVYYGDSYDYTGIVLLQYKGENQWVLNGHRCKSGYTAILDSSMLKEMEKKLGLRMEGQVHGLAYYYLFREKVIPNNIVAEGFSIMNGEYKWNSGVFNARDNDWNQPCSKAMTEDTKEQLTRMIVEWKEAGNASNSLPGNRNFPVDYKEKGLCSLL